MSRFASDGFRRRLLRGMWVTVVASLLASAGWAPSASAAPAGTVTGSVFNDANGDGLRAASDMGVPGRTVFVDFDGDEVFEGGEPSATTTGTGAYTISGVTPGTWKIVLAGAPEWETTTSVPTVTVVDGNTNVGVEHGSFNRGSISGTVYDDTNGNGVRNAGEPPMAGETVFLDADGDDVFDGNEPMRTSATDGRYTFESLGIGSYVVRMLLGAGRIRTTPNPAPIAMSSGYNPSTVDFGQYGYSSISGVVFVDIDADGVVDAGESGRSSVPVLLDLNDNGIADGDERVAVTDGAGHYSFLALTGGTYRVVISPPDGFVETATSAVVIAAGSGVSYNATDIGILNAGVIAGTVFDDAVANGIRDGDDGASPGRTVFLDSNGDGVAGAGEPSTVSGDDGSYLFADLAPGAYRPRVVVPANATATTPAPTSVSVTLGRRSGGNDFGIYVRGSVSGTVYTDTDGDGTRDAGEPASSGRTIYLDNNNSNTYNVGEPTTTSDGSGYYAITGLATGSYRPRIVVSAPTIQTTPVPAQADITSGASAPGRDFGVFVQATLAGSVYNDANGNGTKQASDSGVSGRTVFLDTNDNGVWDTGEKTATTNTSGSYTFSSLNPGTYRVRVVVPVTMVQTSPNPAPVTVTSGMISTGNDIGVFTYGTLSGTVFVDTDGDGVKDTGETTGSSGRTVFLDDDGDNVLDDGEASTTTGGTGVYTFGGLLAGTYVPRLVVPAGLIHTSANPAAITIASGSVAAGNNFGLYSPSAVSGIVFDDVNGSGTKDAIEGGVVDVVVFLDVDSDDFLDADEPKTVTGGGGSWIISGLSPGVYKARIVVPSGRVRTTALGGQLTPGSGTTTANINFGLFSEASITGRVFNDVNGNGTQDGGDIGVAGRTVFLDSNVNGAYNTGEPSALSAEDGSYSFAGLAPGSYRVRIVIPAGSMKTTSDPAPIVPTSASTAAGVNFGMFVLATISGVVFTDLDGDGVRDDGEGGQTGRTVFLDGNNNGVVNAGEATTTTDASGNFTFANLGPGTYRAQIQAPGGTVKTTPDPASVVPSSGSATGGIELGLFAYASITGATYNDTNGNGERNTGEVGVASRVVYIDVDNDGILDTGETSATSNSSGTFTFGSLGPGTYRVRAVVPAGAIQTSASPTPVVVSSGSIASSVDFALFTLGSIAGTVYSDSNANGAKVATETGIGGRTVYLDGNDNGLLDDGEPSTSTSTSGAYVFAGLTAGSYRVRAAAAAGSTQTSADPAVITISSATASTAKDFGFFLEAAISGVIYNDLNGNGVKNTGEGGLPGLTAFLDTDANGTLDDGERRAQSDSDGLYVITGLPYGVYTVRFAGPATAIQTSAALAAVTTASGVTATGKDAGFFTLGRIGGMVFEDVNGNAARDDDEPLIEGATVYLDSNSNNAYNNGEPMALTDQDGVFLIGGLRIGTYKPRVVLPTGKALSTVLPANISVTSGTAITNIAFGRFTPGSISGAVYNDANGNGTKDVGETGSAARTVYMDKNDNGKRDTGEAAATTTATGTYVFNSLTPGTYRPLLLLPSGQTQTTTAPAPVVVVSETVRTGVDFGIRPSTAPTTIKPPVTTQPPTSPGGNPPPVGAGYRMAGEDGGVYAYGDSAFHGSAIPFRPAKRIVGMANTPSDKGYWLAAEDGGIFSFGDARFLGSMGGQPLNLPVVGMASTPSGNGYWLVASDGGIFSFGDARFFGSTGAMRLNQPIVGMASTPSGNGYWLVARDGGIFTFGDARFFGSTGAMRLNQPIVGMAAHGSTGYWLIASDGGIFTFGTAPFHGSAGAIRLNRPVTAIRALPDGSGYWLFASDGGVFTYGRAPYLGGTPAGAARIVA